MWGGVGAVVVLSAFAAPYLARATAGEWRIVFWMTAALAAGLAGTMPRVRGPVQASGPGARERGFGVRELLSARWVFLNMGYLCFGIAYIGFATFLGSRLPAARSSSDMLVATWGGFGVAMMAGAVAAVFVLRSAWLARYAMAASTAAGMLGAIVSTGGSAVATVAGAILVGLNVASTPTVITAYTRQRSSARTYAAAFSAASAAVGLGQLIGPALTGFLADHVGTRAVPLLAAAFYGFASVAGLLDGRSSRTGFPRQN
jgi:predicted MFS family arabinose efflux permease